MTTQTISLTRRMLPPLARVDWMLLFCTLALIGLGLIFIESATQGHSGSSGLAIKQLKFLCMGITVFAVLQRIDYLHLLRWAPSAYAVCLIMLGAVLFTRPINGARSWFNLYFFNLQPSELMKPVLILTLAHYLMYRESYKRFTGLLFPLILCMVPMALILRQPDLGTTMVLVPVGIAMLFAAGARWWHLGLVSLCGAGGLVGMWFTVMQPYQKRRILAWLNPEEYRLREAWQLLQSEVAIGSGRLFGRGWGQSSESGMNLLPEKHTDFIFTVIAEDGGFLLATVALLLLLFVALSGFGIALKTREPAGRLIAVGVSVLLLSQGLLNAGVAVGLLPTTGVTFPFVSYGGSSLLSSIICVGLMINVGSRREPLWSKDPFE